jgi:hypothetical protein
MKSLIFPARQFPELILNESSKNTEKALIKWLRKETETTFSENQSIRGFFGLVEFSFQNCFWNLLSTSDSSQICKIRNAGKLPSPFSRNTLIPSSKKISWRLKTSIWK